MLRESSSTSPLSRALRFLLILLVSLAALEAAAAPIDPSLVKRRRERRRRLGPLVEELRIAGNETFDRDTLLEYMETVESGLFGGVHYDYGTLTGDLDNLERFYAVQGFLGASAVLEDVELSADSLRVRLLIGIYEGPRWRITDIAFEGNEVLPDSLLRASTELERDDPLLSRALDRDWRSILDEYARRSYLDARVEQKIERDDTEHAAQVTYEIVERHRAFIDSILLRGNDRTRDYVVRREIIPRPGDPFDPDETGRTQAELYETGLFHAVWVEPDPADTGLVKKDLIVGVRERPAGALDLSMGYAAVDGIEVGGQIENRNLQGQATRLRLEAEYSEPSRHGRVSVADPWFLGFPVSGELSFMYERNDEGTYVAENFGGSFFLTKALTPAVTVEGGYTYERTIVFDVTETLENVGESYTTDVLLAATYDSRDDVLNAKRGAFARTAVDIASSRLGGTNDYLRTDVTLSGYKEWTHDRVIAGSFTVGWIGPLGSDFEVPASELYLAGGVGSVRGFDRNSLGPEGEGGDAVGGRALMVSRAEVRFPIAGPVTGALFGDAGQVYEHLQSVRLDELAVGAGLGVRYDSPFALFRLDFASPVTDDFRVAWYLGIGQAF
ncbi:MAG: outer membrane protein assembly factor BamA [Candidatus Eisenbacteria bacterium]|nr:outer membrane protein assembly factor BamA [Candidatus Eisenbacteria bacterium]